MGYQWGLPIGKPSLMLSLRAKYLIHKGNFIDRLQRRSRLHQSSNQLEWNGNVMDLLFPPIPFQSRDLTP